MISRQSFWGRKQPGYKSKKEAQDKNCDGFQKRKQNNESNADSNIVHQIHKTPTSPSTLSFLTNSVKYKETPCPIHS